MSELTTDQILDNAADIIQRNGWTQHEYYNWPAPGMAVTNPQQCAVCPRGGMAIAAGRHPEFAASWPEYCPSVEELATESDDRIPSVEDDVILFEVTEAERAFAAHIRKLRPGYGGSFTDRALIEQWNDEAARTADEVITELKACAANLRTAVTA